MKAKSGEVIGRITVLEKAGWLHKDGKRTRVWKCQCICGKEIARTTTQVWKGSGCGCTTGKSRSNSHPLVGTPTHMKWIDMRRRCNPKNANTERGAYWAGRGITICPEWDTFRQFVEDMGECPPGYTLEREKVNGNYCPENCIWATTKTQNRNHTNTKLSLELAEKIRKRYATGECTQTELAGEFGISLQDVHRIVRNKRWVA